MIIRKDHSNNTLYVGPSRRNCCVMLRVISMLAADLITLSGRITFASATPEGYTHLPIQSFPLTATYTALRAHAKL